MSHRSDPGPRRRPPHAGQGPGVSRRPSNRRLVAALIGALLLALWSIVGYWLYAQHERVLAANRAMLSQLTSAAEEHTRRLFRQAETALLVAEHWISAHPALEPGRAPAFADLVGRLQRQSDGMLELRLVSPDGGLYYIPNPGSAPLADVSDRDYYRVQQDPATRGFFIGNPVQGRVSGKRVIPLSMPLAQAGGKTGVLFAVIELAQIAQVFEAERPKPNGAVSIMRSDATFLFRLPDGGIVGRSIKGTPSWEQHISQAARGTYVSDGSAVGTAPKLVSFARLPEYPLYVTVTTELDDVLAPWRREAAILLVLAGLVTAGAGLLGRFLLRAMRAEEQAGAELVRLARHDTLTGLSNRYMFHEYFAKALARAERGGHQLALLFLDLDGFKAINDTLGHLAGDQLLQQVAARLSACMRSGDLVSRLSGDEFTIIVEQCHAEQIDALVDKITQVLAAPFELAGGRAHISASIGTAFYPAGGSDPDALIHTADAAMYRVKKARKKAAPALKG